MERIVLAARLQFGMFPVGADAVQVNQVCRRWFRRIARVLRLLFLVSMCLSMECPFVFA